MKKKNILIAIALVLGTALIVYFLVPMYSTQYKDGGTEITIARIYTVVEWNKLTDEKISKHCVKDGDGYKYEKTSFYFISYEDVDYEKLWEMELEEIAKE